MKQLILTALFVFVSGVVSYFVGRRDGASAERMRVEWILDVAFGVVNSGALWKVRRRIRGEYTDTEFRSALVRECEYREKMRGRLRAGP